MKPILISLFSAALFAFAPSTYAVPLLSPELPAGPVTATAAPWAQNLQGVAPAGSGFVAAWLDARSSYGAPQTNLLPLFTARIGSDGSVAEPFNAKIADRVTGAVIGSLGSAPLLIYSDVDGMWRQRLDDEGHAFGARVQMQSVGYRPVAIGTNGSDFLLAAITSSNRVAAFRLSAAGDVLNTFEFTDPVINGDVSIASTGNDYHVIFRDFTCPGSTPCTSSILDRIVVANNQVIPRALTGDLGQAFRVFAGSSGDRLLVGWVLDKAQQSGATETVTLMPVSADGTPGASKQVSTAPTNSIGAGENGSIGWDGRNFLFAWEQVSGGNSSLPFDLRAVRVATDGTILDSTPVTLGAGYGSAPRFARAAGTTAVLWSDSTNGYSFTDVFARVVDAFESLGDPRGKITVTRSARLQRDPATARVSGGLLTVWRENDDTKTIAGSYRAGAEPAIALTFAAGGQVANSAPAVAVASNDIALVAWVSTNASGSTVFARRVSPNGTPYYENAIEIGHDPAEGYGEASVAIASNGQQFLVAWVAGGQVEAKRVNPDGTVVDASPIVVSRQSTQRFGARSAVNVLWSGSRWLVQWFEDLTNPLILSPPPPPMTNVFTARLTPEGSVIDVLESPQLYTGGGVAIDLASAISGDRVLVAWQQRIGSDTCVQGMTLTLDGAPTSSSAVPVHCTPTAAQQGSYATQAISVAGTSTGFTVAWAEPASAGGRIDGARLTTDLRMLDAAPWAISPDGSVAYAPALLPDGSSVVYARIASEAAYGSVARIFTRAITEAATSRRRAAGR